MGHRIAKFVVGVTLVSCFSVCLLIQQLSRLNTWRISAVPCLSPDCQRHHRYLLMTGDDPHHHQPPKQQQQQQQQQSNESVTVEGGQHHLPRLLIIGVRKGGTRALMEMLNLHPRIAMVPAEMHFFDKIDHYQKGLEWYRSHMPLTTDDQLVVEKSPSYYVTPEVPERVWSMNPSIKLLLIVRDPVTRLLSDFTQIEETRTAHGLPRRRFQDVALLESGEVNTQNRALHISLYAKFLSRWLHVFPRRQLHIVDGDRLVKDPGSEIELVERFLELEHRVRRDQFYFNVTKGFYCLQDAHLHKCLTGSKGRRHPQVPMEAISTLRQFFAPHNRKFFAMVGQTFNWPET